MRELPVGRYRVLERLKLPPARSHPAGQGFGWRAQSRAGRRYSFPHRELLPVPLDGERCDGPINRGGALEALDNRR